MRTLLEKPVPRAIAVGLLAAALYLALVALTDGLDAAKALGAIGVAIGAGVGSEIGRRRAGRRRGSGSGRG